MTVPVELKPLLRAEPMPGSVEAMLATLTDKRFSDPAWIFERKLDGVRAIAVNAERGPSLWSRTIDRPGGRFVSGAIAAGFVVLLMVIVVWRWRRSRVGRV